MKKTKKPTHRQLIKKLTADNVNLMKANSDLDYELTKARNEYRDRGKELESLTQRLDSARAKLGELRAHVVEYTLATNEPVTATPQRLQSLQQAIADACRDDTFFRTPSTFEQFVKSYNA